MVRLSIVPVLVLVLFEASIAAPAIGKDQSDIRATSFDYTAYLNAGNILMFVSNRGIIGRDIAGVFGQDAGTFFPYTTVDAINDTYGHFVVYSTGLWLGGLVNGDTLVSVAEYVSEYWPGPMVNGTYIPTANTDPRYHIYTLYSDSLEGNPNADYLAWPVEDGAPVSTAGKPLMKGDQMLWGVWNDGNESVHSSAPGSTSPLGLEVSTVVHAYDVSNVIGNIVFIEHTIYNRGGKHIDDLYLGVWVDPDIGYSSDDKVGCDPSSDLFFAYNGSSYDNFYGSPPPAVGFKVLIGPQVVDMGHTARFGEGTVPNRSNLGLTAFVGSNTGQASSAFRTSYRYLQGLLASGTPYTYNGSPTAFWFAGDPVSGMGDIDLQPSDHWMMGSMGPVDMAPGDSQFVSFAMIVGAGSSYLQSITQMRSTATMLNSSSCCTGLTGDFDGNGSPEPDPVDLAAAVDFFFEGGDGPPCEDEGNVDGRTGIDPVDLSWLVDYLYNGGPAPMYCPE